MKTRSERSETSRTFKIYKDVAAIMVIAVVLSSLSSCVISPQPEPPSVNTERITAELLNEQSVRFVGAPGAVSIGNVDLSIINVDSALSSAIARVNNDGSFDADVLGVAGDQFRFQALSPNLNSDPVHVVVPDSDGPVSSANIERTECIRVEPGDENDFGTVRFGDTAAATVTITNSCEEAITIDWMYLAITEEFQNFCSDIEEMCIEGVTTQTATCELEFETCQESCSEEYDQCILDGGTEELCTEELLDCYFECIEDEFDCVEVACDLAYEECIDEGLEEHHGFDLTFSTETPFEIDNGDQRSAIVTFSPINEGLSQELLIIEFGNPAEQRSVLLFGQGDD